MALLIFRKETITYPGGKDKVKVVLKPRHTALILPLPHCMGRSVCLHHVCRDHVSPHLERVRLWDLCSPRKACETRSRQEETAVLESRMEGESSGSARGNPLRDIALCTGQEMTTAAVASSITYLYRAGRWAALYLAETYVLKIKAPPVWLLARQGDSLSDSEGPPCPGLFQHDCSKQVKGSDFSFFSPLITNL